MSIESDLYATLSGDAGVTALCSTRIYPNLAPESVTFPYCAYQMVSGLRLSTITGVGDALRKRLQISCHANTYSEAKALAVAVEAALDGDGYLALLTDYYDPTVQVHTSVVDWSFMTPS